MTTPVRRDDVRERGATSVLVALLLSGVMLGMLVLASDTGNLMWERRQLQNSADATSLALAQICANKLSDCNASTTVSTLEALGDQNAADGRQALDGDGRPNTLNGQCGRVPGATNMPTCTSSAADADIADLRECPALPAWLRSAPTIKYVEAYTKSESAQGPFLRFFFADGEKAVTSCARAAWGPVKTARQTIPFTFSLCEFEAATTSGVFPTSEVAIGLKYKSAAACDTWHGSDFPGGFGWLQQTSCLAQLDINSWVKVEPGVGSGNPCTDEILATVGTDVLIPIFDCVNDSKVFCPPGLPHGSWSYYHIKGFATFHITAVDITGRLKAGTPSSSAKAMCNHDTTDKKCLYGYFVKKALTADAAIDPSAPDYGTTIVVPAG